MRDGHDFLPANGLRIDLLVKLLTGSCFGIANRQMAEYAFMMPHFSPNGRAVEPCRRVTRPRFSRQSGFSLVEIAIAIGILSFAMIALFGLLPVGMGSLRDSISTSTQTQIVSRVLSDAQLSDFTKYTGGTYYFNDEGSPVTGASDDADAFKGDAVNKRDPANFKAVVTLKSNSGPLSHLSDKTLSQTVLIQIYKLPVASKPVFTTSTILVKND